MAAQLSSTKELLSALVGFDTTSAKTNLALIDFIQTYLEGHGIGSDLVMNDAGDKASLFATIGEGEHGIGLSGHTDVVPVAGQNWECDPFELTEKDGKLFGRGSADMKGYLACMLAMVPEYLGRDLKRPLHLIFSYDEEVGCTGVRPLIDELGMRLPRPAMVIVGEPTNMSVVDAHKSINVFKTEISGKEAHSSMPRLGVNAIAIGAAYIAELSRLSKDLNLLGNDPRFNPPHGTIHVGNIEGGTAHNIVPKSCRFIWEIRALPECDPQSILALMSDFAEETLLPDMRAVSADASIETIAFGNVPGFVTPGGSEAVSLVLQLAEQNETHAVSYGTEAGLFELGGCPTVICGPGSIEQAHQPNEFIEVEELVNCLEFLDRLADVI